MGGMFYSRIISVDSCRLTNLFHQCRPTSALDGTVWPSEPRPRRLAPCSILCRAFLERSRRQPVLSAAPPARSILPHASTRCAGHLSAARVVCFAPRCLRSDCLSLYFASRDSLEHIAYISVLPWTDYLIVGSHLRQTDMSWTINHFLSDFCNV